MDSVAITIITGLFSIIGLLIYNSVRIKILEYRLRKVEKRLSQDHPRMFNRIEKRLSKLEKIVIDCNHNYYRNRRPRHRRRH